MCLIIRSPFGLAEEFLGQEGEDYPEYTEEAQEAPRAAKSRPYDDASGGDVTLSGGIGAGVGFFSANLSISYGLSKYFTVDTSGRYRKFESGDTSGEEYGPEVDLVLRLANPTIVTPFVGAGPGYWKWIREYKGEAFDDNASFTANAFGGIHIRLTKHFGIQGVRKQTTYLGDAPIRFDDRKTKEERSSVVTHIGFHLTF